ncbi:hypothetical protein [Neochlamydia sp. S13]|nr:hypothetical protein [Neochlamydia sp. S13]
MKHLHDKTVEIVEGYRAFERTSSPAMHVLNKDWQSSLAKRPIKENALL